MFTRQHYTMIADTLSLRAKSNVEHATVYLNWLTNNEDQRDNPTEMYTFNRDFALLFAAAIQEDCRCMESFAKEFRGDNWTPEFDREKFLDACGYYKYLGVAAEITRNHQPVYFTSQEN